MDPKYEELMKQIEEDRKNGSVSITISWIDGNEIITTQPIELPMKVESEHGGE